jgi:hypothetical protein
MRTPAALACLLGGVSWLGAFLVDNAIGGGLVDALTWAGAALLAICATAAGASLVSQSAPLLRVLVGVCFAVLVASVLQVVRQSGDAIAIDAVFGGLAAGVATVAMVRAWASSAMDAPRAELAVEPAAHRLAHRGRGRGAHAR